MTYVRARTVMAAALLAALPGVAAAQFPPPPAPSGSPPPVQDRWPDPPKQPAARTPAPAQRAAPPPKREPARAATRTPSQRPKPRSAANVVACDGAFAKDSSHLKLAQKYDSRNVVFGKVDGSDGSKIDASILFPNDPRRRLEVLWNNVASRSDTAVIAINGKSSWVAPKGLKLGLPIAALEKLNRRPFKLTGFGKDSSASVAAWEGGSLTTLPGGCKVGIRLFANAKASEALRNAVSGDRELLSNDAGVRAVRPTIGEILIGY